MIRKLRPSSAKWLFVTLLSFCILALGYWVNERSGLFIGLLVGAILLLISQSKFSSPLRAFLNPKWLAGPDPWRLNEKSSNISRLLEIPAPKMALCLSPSSFACVITEAFGPTSIAISTGALHRLPPEELDALLIEMHAFSKECQSLRFNVTQLLAEQLTMLANRVDVGTRWFRPLGWLSYSLHILVAGLQRIALPKKSFYSADSLAGAALAHRVPLAHALEKLSHAAELKPLRPPLGTAAFFIVSPSGKSYSSRWLNPHPALHKRIFALVGTYPI